MARRLQVVGRRVTTAEPTLIEFAASADHTSLLSYEARVRLQGTTSTVLVIDLGKPTPVGGTCSVNIASQLSGLSPGTYVAAVIAISPVGPSSEANSNAFVV